MGSVVCVQRLCQHELPPSVTRVPQLLTLMLVVQVLLVVPPMAAPNQVRAPVVVLKVAVVETMLVVMRPALVCHRRQEVVHVEASLSVMAFDPRPMKSILPGADHLPPLPLGSPPPVFVLPRVAVLRALGIAIPVHVGDVLHRGMLCLAIVLLGVLSLLAQVVEMTL